jgi:hypothetical protein
MRPPIGTVRILAAISCGNSRSYLHAETGVLFGREKALGGDGSGKQRWLSAQSCRNGQHGEVARLDDSAAFDLTQSCNADAGPTGDLTLSQTLRNPHGSEACSQQTGLRPVPTVLASRASYCHVTPR